MIVKICGIKDQHFLQSSSNLEFDMAGFIFYPGSKRYIDDEIYPGDMDLLPLSVKRTGVFVNQELQDVIEIANAFSIDYVQLHGDEDPLFFKKLSAEKFELIKAFAVDEGFNFNTVLPFQEYCRYFLFDTKTKHFGGSGIKFNWELLTRYKGITPFLLSGGIGPGDVQKIKHFSHPMFAGIDINSKFETSPGVKDTAAITNFLKQLA